MKKLLYLLILVSLTFNSCEVLESLGNKKIIIGKQTKDCVYSSFEPFTIELEYGISSEIIELMEIECLKIYNYFYVNKMTGGEYPYKEISTLTNCKIKADNGKLSIYKKDDKVKVDEGDYESFERYDIVGLEDESYIVVKVESSRTYIGWVQISKKVVI